MKLSMRKVSIGGTTCLVAADDHTHEYMKKLSLTDVLLGDFAKPRNVAFHRKYFALLNTAYEMWDAPHQAVHNGKTYEVEKSMGEFRKWIIVMAGHHDPVVYPSGQLKFVPRSISFAKMTEDEFTSLYSDTINAIIKHVLPDDKPHDEYMAIFQRILDYD